MEEKIRIKSGIEIHQQLNTGKLFCRCPSILRSDPPDVIIHRRLRAVAGETGKIDIAAQYEAGQDKEFVYQGYSDTNCLLEYDECPPMEMDEEALQTALHISLLLNCEIIPIAQIMRKTVVDGSNTSGFQRTVLIARNGVAETKSGRVPIDYVFLEEDAARPASAKGDEADAVELDGSSSKTFKLDRLGIPLVEIATGPHMTSAEQIKEVALHIGDVLRSCKVRRGIGTIRQDLNVSIPGSERVEIKGFQDPKMMIQTVELEVQRQQECVKNKSCKKEVRKANIDGTTSFLRPMPGESRMYPETDLPLLRIKKEIIDEAKRTLPKLRSEVRGELAKKGLTEEQVKILLKEGGLEEFEELLEIIDEPKFIFKVLIEIPKEIASHEKIDNIGEKLTLDVIEEILNFVKENKIERHNIKHVMEEVVKGKPLSEAVKIEKIDSSEMEAEIAKLVKEKPGLSIGGYMGLIMAKFKGKISGKEATEILKKLVK